jgi:hypothetical protein
LPTLHLDDLTTVTGGQQTGPSPRTDEHESEAESVERAVAEGRPKK